MKGVQEMGGNMNGMISLLLIVAMMWFLLIRPQQKQAKKRAEMLTALKVGDKIVTIGGICGEIKQITDTKIFIEIADGIVIEMLRNSISSVETAEEELDDPFADDEDDDDDDLYYDDEDDVIDVDDATDDKDEK